MLEAPAASKISESRSLFLRLLFEPRAALDYFACASVAWGFPARLLKESKVRTHVFPVVSEDPRYSKKMKGGAAAQIAEMIPIQQAQFLRPPEMSGLPTRILGQPNLSAAPRAWPLILLSKPSIVSSNSLQE